MRISVLLIITLFTFNVFAQDIATEKANEIKNKGDIYYWGEGTGVTEQDADMQALAALGNNIKVTISRVSISKADEINDKVSNSTSVQTEISSFTTLTNTEQIILNREPNARILRYIKKSELEEIFNERENKVRDLVNQGRKMENIVELSSALKYFNWALSLSTIHPRVIYATINNKEENLKIWLNAKINSIFENIKVDVDNIEEQSNDFDKYIVNLRFSYMGYAVSGIDYSYFNGLKKVDNCHAKNGVGIAEFPELPKKEIELSWEYKYVDVAKAFDEELKSYYETNAPITFQRSNINIPIKIKKGKIKVSHNNTPSKEASTAIAPPEVAKERIRVNTPIVKNDSAYVNTMQQVEMAIRNGNIESVKDFFTEEGYKLFLTMMNSGKFTVLHSPSYTVEQSESFIVGKYIPVNIKYKGNHSCAENIIFRFDDKGLVESMAYALTKRAEDDIFRQSQWKMSARYSIMHFMEDYQTAFALKRLDFISKIFSEDAIIIHGKVIGNNNRKKNGYTGIDGIYKSDQIKVTYSNRSKEEYLKYLERDFKYKRYIKLTFEDNEIAQANTNDLTGDVYWIEIKQFYSSNTYSDQGYLTLMLDMSDISPIIKIRTWTPQKVELDDMMKRFTIE